MTVPPDIRSPHTPRPPPKQHIAQGFSLPNAALATAAVAALLTLAFCNASYAGTSAPHAVSAAPCTSSC